MHGCTSYTNIHTYPCTYAHNPCVHIICVLYHHNICHQIFSEFNRIFEKEIIKDIKEIWLETIPKIFDITKIESNAKLQSLYEESVTCTSEGIARCLFK